MVKKPYLAKSKGIGFRNFGHKQGIQVHKKILVQLKQMSKGKLMNLSAKDCS